MKVFSIEAVKAAMVEFKNQGHEKVFISSCCGRTYVGAKPALKCRTCEKPPESHEEPTDGSTLEAEEPCPPSTP